jgi:3-oxoacyl-[acyl-carrier-protein] synthase II
MKLAITGVGIVSPLGNTLSENIKNLKALEVPIQDYRQQGHFSDWILEVKKAFHCNYDDVDIEHLIKKKDKRWIDPTVVSSMIAVEEAVIQSGLDFPHDTPVIVGTIRGGAPNLARYGQILNDKRRKVHPQILLSSSHEYVSNHISSHYKWHGPSMGTSGTCISGVQALDIAKKYMITEGYTCAIVGGTDFMTSSMSTIYFQLLGAISQTGKSVPWDESRDGFVMGEGSVYLVVEPLELARKRGANIRWVVDGLGIANDGAHPTQPDLEGTGARIAIDKALSQAGTSAGDYNVLNAHATSTPFGDPVEYNVLKDYFPEQSYLYGNKGQIGHLMGASGLAEVVLGAEAMVDGFVPANAGLEKPFTDDNYFNLLTQPTEESYTRMFKTSFGFGGRSAAVSIVDEREI